MKQLVEECKQWNGFYIFTGGTQYHVLISLSIILMSNIERKAVIVLISPTREEYEKSKELKEKIENNTIIKVYLIHKKKKIYRLLGISEFTNTKLIKHIFIEKRIESSPVLLINFNWNQKIVRYPASMFLKRCEKSIFIEDGAAQYMLPDEPQIINYLKVLYGNQYEFWKMEKIHSIHVQNPEGYPDYLQKKIVPLKLELKNGTDMEKWQTQIMDVFLNGSIKHELIQLKTNVRGIIFTQPLSEDGLFSEERKREIYYDICDFYKRYGVICVKKHPRDLTEYSFGNGVIELKGSYPSELLNLLGFHFLFAVGISTSAVVNVNAENKFNLNSNFYSELSYEKKYVLQNE